VAGRLTLWNRAIQSGEGSAWRPKGTPRWWRCARAAAEDLPRIIPL